MKRKVIALVLVVILIGLSVSACTRSATKGPEGATATSELPFPVGTMDPGARVTEIIQQTQAALNTPEAPPTSEGEGSGEPQPTAVVVATQAPAEVVPTATLPVIPTLTRPATYTLQKGEWPICIARRYNLDLAGFFSANNLTMNSRPDVGKVLNIPASGTWSSGPRALKTHPADYTVQAGDTIYSIACDFGDVDPLAIAVANNLQSPYTLTSGAKLRIP